MWGVKLEMGSRFDIKRRENLERRPKGCCGLPEDFGEMAIDRSLFPLSRAVRLCGAEICQLK